MVEHVRGSLAAAEDARAAAEARALAERVRADAQAKRAESLEADLAEACALIGSALAGAPSAFAARWTRAARDLVDRNEAIVEKHRAPADWGRGARNGEQA